MDVDQHQLDLTITFLQTIQKELPKFNDLSDKNRRAIFALAEKNEELSAVNRELATAKAGLTEAMRANEERHVANLERLQGQLGELRHEISKAEAKLQEVEAKTAKKEGEYSSYVRGITALKKQLEVAA
jgi:chromosome segregation ATPase